MSADGQRRAPLVVSVVDGRGRPVRVPGLGTWLSRVAPSRARGEVTVALVSDLRVRTLNRTYRGIDEPTDVLSFPAVESARRDRHLHLGDVVIARGVARRQARAERHPEATELKVLALHGLLHLLGYDHESDNGAMHRVERRLRRKGGLERGLIERGRQRR